MVDHFKAVVSALGKIPGLTVFETSEGVDEGQIKLPCAIVDFEPASIEAADESGSRFYINCQFGIELHVARTPNKRSNERDQAMALFQKSLIEIIKVFPRGVSILDSYIGPTELKNQQSFVWATLIKLNRVPFKLS